MDREMFKRAILPNSKDFKKFWEKEGPFQYALTSSEFPPVLLDPEEWIFSNDLKVLLKVLIQFDKRKMKFVKAPFNSENKTILRPEALSPWKIINFPEEWNACICDLFVPEGHLTKAVFYGIDLPEGALDPGKVEEAFFQSLSTQMDRIGYLLFKPQGASKYAAVKKYLAEWEEDEQEAGLL